MNKNILVAIMLLLLIFSASFGADQNRARQVGNAIGKLARLEAEYHRQGKALPEALVRADTLYAELMNSYKSNLAVDYVNSGEAQWVGEIVELTNGLPSPSATDAGGRIAAALAASDAVDEKVKPLLDGYAGEFQLAIESRRYLRMLLGTAEVLTSVGLPVTLAELGLDRADSATVKAIAEAAADGGASERGSEAYLFYSTMLDLDDLGGRFGRSQSEVDLADRVMGGLAYQRIADKLKAIPAMRLVFFGDSQTDNRHWSSPAHFPKIVEEVFRRVNPSIAVFNAGIGGDDSGEGLERIGKDVLIHKPHVCFILFGGNDAAFKNDKDGAPNLPPDAFKENIDSMVVLLKTIGCKPVILSHPINLQPPPYMGPESSELLSIMNDDQREIRVTHGTGWIDLFAVFAVRDHKRMYSVDNDHFSPEAHGVIAEEILRHLAEMH